MRQSNKSSQGSGSVTLSLAASGSTRWWPVRGRRLDIPVSWTGTPSGTFSLEYKRPDGSAAAVPGASAEFTASGNAQPAGSASGALWNWSNLPAKEVRITYTLSGGTGSATLAPSFGD